ncbi:MAG: actinodefensin-associated protein B [Pseudonocardiales bacterium]
MSSPLLGNGNGNGVSDTRLRLTPGTSVTKLPFGGAALVNATTLGITDCGEREAEILELLLAHGMPGPGGPPDVRELAGQLIGAGWLMTEPPAERN